MVLLNRYTALKRIQHVETATDKKRHVEGMKKGMLKNAVPESGMLKLLQKKKRHVEGIKTACIC